MKPTTITQLAKEVLTKSLTDNTSHVPQIFSLKLEDPYFSEIQIKVGKNKLGMITYFCTIIQCSKPKIDPHEKFIYPHLFNDEDEFTVLVNYQCMLSRQQFEKQHKLNLALARQMSMFGKKEIHAATTTEN